MECKLRVITLCVTRYVSEQTTESTDKRKGKRKGGGNGECMQVTLDISFYSGKGKVYVGEKLFKSSVCGYIIRSLFLL